MSTQLPAQCRERYEQVVELTLWGLTNTQIAEKLNVSVRTVQRARKVFGVAQEVPPGRPILPDELARIEFMLSDGVSLNEIARTLNRPQGSIATRFKGRSSVTSADGARMRRMFAELEALDWDTIKLKAVS